MARVVQKLQKAEEETSGKLLRVAAYCRISTPEQVSSLQSQIEHYTGYIQNHPGWISAGVFADTISGTSFKERPEFQKLLRKCSAGKVDMIICKSVSRFGRNVRETLNVLDRLKDKNVGVFFEDSQINSLDEQVQSFLTVYSIQAQQESLDKAGNVRWGIQKRFQSGDSGFINKPCYGYRQNEDGELYLEYAEAYAVRKIFERYLDGDSLRTISDNLSGEQIPSPSGKERWSAESINELLKNRKYTGDVLLQKTFVSDTLKHKTKKNRGEMDQYLITDNHRAIIDRDTFFAAQEEMERRSSGQGTKNTPRTRYSSKGLSGLIVCGGCGRSYQRVTRTKNGVKVYVWRCASRLEKGNRTCQKSPTVLEDELKERIMDELKLDEWDEKLARKRVKNVTIEGDRTISVKLLC